MVLVYTCPSKGSCGGPGSTKPGPHGRSGGHSRPLEVRRSVWGPSWPPFDLPYFLCYLLYCLCSRLPWFRTRFLFHLFCCLRGLPLRPRAGAFQPVAFFQIAPCWGWPQSAGTCSKCRACPGRAHDRRSLTAVRGSKPTTSCLTCHAQFVAKLRTT